MGFAEFSFACKVICIIVGFELVSDSDALDPYLIMLEVCIAGFTDVRLNRCFRCALLLYNKLGVIS